MEYWKFPTSEDLFICRASDADMDKQSFRLLMEQQQRADSDGREDILGEKTLIATATSPDVVMVDTMQQQSSSSSSSSSGKQWRRIAEVSTIRHVVDLLGHSPAEQRLKKNIVNFLLLERGASSSTSSSSSSSSSSDPIDSKPVAEGDPERTGTALTDWLGAKSTAVGSIDETTTTTTTAHQSVAVAASTNHNQTYTTKKPALDIVPASLRLQTHKGVDISPVYVIQQETVFEDRGGERDDLEEGDGEGEETRSSSNEFFTFGRKYVHNPLHAVLYMHAIICISHFIFSESSHLVL